jgi:hypothetical protein
MKKQFLIVFAFTLINTVFAQNFWQQTKGPYGGRIESLGIDTSGNVYAGAWSWGIFRSDNTGENFIQGNGWVGQGRSIRSFARDSSGQMYAVAVSGSGDTEFMTFNGNDWAPPYTLHSPYVGTVLAIKSNDTILLGTESMGVVMRWGETWYSSTNFTSGHVSSLAIHSNGDIFAGTWGQGIYRTINNGYSWQQMNNGLTNLDIRTIAINPTGVIFAGTQSSGVFKSTNSGGTWVSVGLGGSDIWSLAINSQGHLFASKLGGKGIYRSTDDGDTWINLGSKIRSIWSLIIDSRDVIHAGTSGYGIYRSSDNGENWTDVGLLITDVGTVAVNSHGDIFAGTDDAGISRSTNCGDTWVHVDPDYEYRRSITKICINSLGTIFMGTFYGGAFRSTDNGDSWTSINNGLTGDVYCFAFKPNGDVFASTNGQGVFRSTNNGDNWISINSGLTNLNVFSLAVNSSGDIFAGTNGQGIFHSTDNGENWHQTNAGLAGSWARSLAINSADHIFAGMFGQGVFRSTDNGSNWTQEDSSISALDVTSLIINPTDKVFAATFGQGIFQSTDNGNSWSQFSSGLGNLHIIDLATNSIGEIFAGMFSYKYAYGAAGVFRSIRTTGVVEQNPKQLPLAYTLEQNFPNPFNPTTTISFLIPRSGYVTLRILNLLGEEISTLVAEELHTGTYTIHWNASNYPSGVYFYRLQVDSFSETKKLLLLR